MLQIRPAVAADAKAIAEIYAPYVRETVISFEETPPDAAEIGRRMAETMRIYPWLVAEEDGRIAGYAYAGRQSARAAYAWAAEATVYLHPDYQRRGLGRRLYQALFAVLKAQGVHSLMAIIALPNEASVALHRALGLEEIGVCREAGFKFGAWRDVMFMGTVIGARGSPHAPPRPFSELANLEKLLRESA